jgi:hypothetical protein
MMEREGCAPGYEHRGDACYLKNRVRNIPFSVTSKAGCLNFGGKWLDEYSVCVMKDKVTKDEIAGWTAPIRGLYYMWWLDRFNPKEYADYNWDEYLGELEEKGLDVEDYTYEGGMVGCFVKKNEEYPKDGRGCVEATRGMYPWEFQDPEKPSKFHEMGTILRREALTEARKLVENIDREELHKYLYFDEAGRKLPMWRPGATPVEIHRWGDYEGESLSHSDRKPFGIRRHRDD